MKPIHRIITVILLSLFFQSQTTVDKGTNEISRTEQKMQGLGKLELVIQNGHTGALKGILLSEDKTKLFSYIHKLNWFSFMCVERRAFLSR
jgi:hypothetical protein